MFFHSKATDPDKQFEAFKQGEPSAFRYYFDRHNRSLYHIILGVVRIPEEAEDIVVNAFEKLWLDRERMNDADHIERYLFIVARNGAIDFFRKLNTRRKAQGELGLLADLIYIEPTEEEINRIRLLEKIVLEVQNFPAKQKKVFLHFFYKAEDVRSISNQLGIKEQTVRNHLSRAIMALRKALQ
jgi:RNA polymerase sigma factor (sigma-70 family)